VSILAAAPIGSVLQQLNHGSGIIDVAAALQRIRDDLHPGQLEFVDDQTTQILGVSAGYGAGKTRALCAKAVHLAAVNQGFIGAVMEPTGPLIRDIWQNDFDDFLESYDIPYTFRASPLPEYVLHLPLGDTKILCRSFENWTRIIGLNLAWVLADEIDTVAPSIASRAFPKILGRLRAGNIRQNIDNEPLRVGIDFNVTNMSAVIGIRSGNGLVIIDEISGAHDTDALGAEIRRRYPDHRIYGYPDASGGNRSTNAAQTDIQILGTYGISNQSPKANPPVRDRLAAVQALLENGKGEIRLRISHACKRMIECLELQCYTEKGDPDKDAGHDHMNDALGYVIWREFNPLHAGAGRSTGIRLY
jgi:hypothetical protein